MPKNNVATIYKSPLKWAGGKRRLVSKIASHIPFKSNSRLIEPFVGGGSVFLNLSFSELLLVDSNPDLIGMFTALQQHHGEYHAAAEHLFTPHYNNAEAYYELRQEFNKTEPSMRRWALFLYLNRHGYNGLCRYNQKGAYNVPFGKYKRPYFPASEMLYFHKKIQDAHLHAGDFSYAFDMAQCGDIIYCDPPYLAVNKTANFTAYSGKAFSFDDQKRLALLAENARDKGITTIISNHYLDDTLQLYKHADKIVSMDVSRTISCKGAVRKPIKELMAVYQG